MLRRSIFALVAALTIASARLDAAVNLNSSKSNAYRIVYDPSVIGESQVSSLLASLEKTGPGADEAAVRRILQQHGANTAVLKKISVRVSASESSKARLQTLILLLGNPADEAEALRHDAAQNAIRNVK